MRGFIVRAALVAAGLTARTAAAELVAESDVFTAAIDTRESSGVRKPATAEEILPIAWNGDAEWAIGGGSAATQVRVTKMSGEADGDPSLWLAGEVADVVDSVGEGTLAWLPTQRRLYRLELIVDGATVATTWWNLSELPELAAVVDVNEFSVELETDVFTCDGRPHFAVPTVIHGGKLLTEGVDYKLEYHGYVNAGTARIDLIGLGDYAGARTIEYAIAPHVPETVAESAETAASGLDTRGQGLVTPLAIPEFLDLAWSSAPWAIGGDSQTTATLTVAAITGEEDADRATWIVGETETIMEPASGEGACAWHPEVRGLFRLALVAGGQEVASAILNTLHADGLSDLTPLENVTFVLSASEFVCDGHPHVPTVSVTTEDGKTLVEGVDYTITVSDCVNPGLGKIQVVGKGSYKGTATTTYVIRGHEPEELAASGESSFALDSREGDLMVRRRSDVLDFAWNTAKDWTPGGDADGGRTALMSVAEFSDPAVLPGAADFKDVGGERTGEGTCRWRATRAPIWCEFRLQPMKDGQPDGDPLTRRFNVLSLGRLCVIVR